MSGSPTSTRNLRSWRTTDLTTSTRSTSSFEVVNYHLCIEFELLGRTLFAFCSSRRARPLPPDRVAAVARDVLTGLAFCHRSDVVHGDVKPENIVFADGACERAKLIDFGSACYIWRQRFACVQSLFYRAPEVVMRARYGPLVDMWSFRCVLAEIATGRPLFATDSEREQMRLIASVLGPRACSPARAGPPASGARPASP